MFYYFHHTNLLKDNLPQHITLQQHIRYITAPYKLRYQEPIHYNWNLHYVWNLYTTSGTYELVWYDVYPGTYFLQP